MSKNQLNEKKSAISNILREIESLEEFESTNPYVEALIMSRLTLLDGLLENIEYGDLTFNKIE